MQIETTKKKFTVEDYYHMAEAGILQPDERVELIEGEVVEMSPIGDPHGVITDRANMIFARGLGDKVVVSVQRPVRINRYNELQPDVVLIRPRENFYGTRHPRPEDVVLLIEVSDTTLRKDQLVKLPIYARSGIPEVWIIDINADAIHTYRQPQRDRYLTTASVGRGESVSPAAFPEFVMRVEDLLGPKSG
ncbi:MAG TPA: Uma2 family endonuclease [Terriglobia bacterium]|nr:Uma2 family endonuclease [Terriglobia bacterium]